MSQPFIGEIRIVGYNFAQRGFAFCAGQLLPISQNTALFSILGTTYGGDGRTTFGLPDLRERMPMHPGAGAGLTPRTIGEITGSAEVTLSPAQIPSHSHEPMANGGRANQSNSQSNFLARGQTVFSNAATSTVPLDATAIPNQGANEAHNNQSPYLAVNFVIALTGTFPSRS